MSVTYEKGKKKKRKGRRTRIGEFGQLHISRHVAIVRLAPSSKRC